MKIRTSDRALAYLTLLCGLTISAVAIWYSVAGLVAIFAAAVIPIIVMGTVLEVSKLVATIWLKWNWKRAPFLIKTYLLTAIAVLMLLTSMGIFGFLSKAHLDQAVPTGDVVSKIELIDEKIKTERDNIEAARKALAQMDAQVDQVLGRTEDARGAERAVQIRRNQSRERTALQADIAKAQTSIAKLNEERAPISAELRQVEAKVGPIKYIASLIYGDNPEDNLLERAVRWVIIVIVLVFDPLAIVMLLASQHSFQWFRQEDEEKEKDNAEGDSPRGTTDVVDTEPPTVTESTELDEPRESKKDPHFPGWMFKDSHIEINETNEPAIEETKIVVDDDDILNSATPSEKAAMTAWKHDHPESSLKLQRRLFDKGIIKQLPWTDYVRTAEASEEAQKWAEENAHIEEARAAEEWADENSNQSGVAWMETDDYGNQIKKIKNTYQQNAEQNEQTLWQRIQDAKK
jgi:hypothetical protein